MKPVQREEILALAEYEQIRAHFRARVIEEKKARRVVVSDIMSVSIENRDTVLLQVQEMLRTERITRESAILHELETYNELVPADNQLSFTLFIEISDAARREKMLGELAGLEEKVFVEVDGTAFAASSKERKVEGYERTTAVHYFKADLSEAASLAIRDGRAKVAFLVKHSAHSVRQALPPAALRALAEDFT